MTVLLIAVAFAALFLAVPVVLVALSDLLSRHEEDSYRRNAGADASTGSAVPAATGDSAPDRELVGPSAHR